MVPLVLSCLASTGVLTKSKSFPRPLSVLSSEASDSPHHHKQKSPKTKPFHNTNTPFPHSNGDTILYSIPKSLENTDPVHHPTSKGAALLHRSVGCDVRVHRSHSCRSRYAPSAGLHYDSLYRVVGAEPNHRRNDRGGVYTRYVLRRCPGQEPLDSIHRRSPTRRQKRDLRHAWDLPWL